MNEQVKAIREMKVSEADWRGQLLTFHAEGKPKGETLEIHFAETMDKRAARKIARVAFREAQNDRTRALDYERFFVTEILKSVEGRKTKAAEILGKAPREVGTIVRDLEIQI